MVDVDLIGKSFPDRCADFFSNSQTTRGARPDLGNDCAFNTKGRKRIIRKLSSPQYQKTSVPLLTKPRLVDRGTRSAPRKKPIWSGHDGCANLEALCFECIMQLVARDATRLSQGRGLASKSRLDRAKNILLQVHRPSLSVNLSFAEQRTGGRD